MLQATPEGLIYAPSGGSLADVLAPAKKQPAREKFGLTDADFARFADLTGATPAHARAIFEVESAGRGFVQSEGVWVPTLLFEAHIFHRESGRYPIRSVAPHLSSPMWDRSLYQRVGRALRPGENRQHARLAEAVELDQHFDAGGFLRIAALRSCSWGLGQVMAFNAESIGYTPPGVAYPNERAADAAATQAFVTAMYRSEADQFEAVARFIVANSLADELRRAGTTSASWVPLVSRYNGPGFRANNYHVKAATAYRRAGGR